MLMDKECRPARPRQPCRWRHSASASWLLRKVLHPSDGVGRHYHICISRTTVSDGFGERASTAWSTQHPGRNTAAPNTKHFCFELYRGKNAGKKKIWSDVKVCMREFCPWLLHFLCTTHLLLAHNVRTRINFKGIYRADMLARCLYDV